MYRRVLAPAGPPAPRFHGAAAAGPAGEMWLVLGHLERLPAPARQHRPRPLGAGRRWAGRFHAEHEARSRGLELSFLNAYDADYYAGWRGGRRIRRRGSHGLPLAGRPVPAPRRPWPGCWRPRGPSSTASTIPRNLLVSEGTVYPVDWESAALGPGEIDLATLTDRCDPEIVRRCELAYRLARWPRERQASAGRWTWPGCTSTSAGWGTIRAQSSAGGSGGTRQSAPGRAPGAAVAVGMTLSVPPTLKETEMIATTAAPPEGQALQECLERTVREGCDVLPAIEGGRLRVTTGAA